MKIIIVGIGKVGKALTELLSQEGHDVIIIDNDAEVIEEAVQNYDVRGVIGNGASYDNQVKAEASKADILIATTESDELNILSCLVGIKNGIKHTIARVRNPEYANQINFMHQELGLSMIVNPELEAANEIYRMLRIPSALKVETFAKGKVDMVEVLVNKDSNIVEKSLYAIRNELKLRFLVCAVEREGTVYIPDGRFIIHEKDKLYIIASPADMGNFFRKIGILKKKSKSVMIVGGGKISYYLTKKLIESNVKVKIIELDHKRCKELNELLPDVDIINGDGNNQDLLLEEGLGSVDALITLTGYDEENIIISLYAETLKVPKVITKVTRNNINSILNAVGLNSVVSPKVITANRILSYVRSLENTSNSKVQTLYKLVDNQIEAVEFYIPDNTSFTGIPLKELTFEKGNLIACIVRKNSIIIPDGDEVINPEDSVIVITKEVILNFEDLLK